MIMIIVVILLLQTDVTRDACFNGAGLPILTFLTDASVWRWHILGQRLPEGTECQFTTEVEDGYTLTLPRLQMSTSCTVGGSDSSVIPATCSESTALGCPCQCSEGFRTDLEEVGNSLTCKSKTWIQPIQRKANYYHVACTPVMCDVQTQMSVPRVFITASIQMTVWTQKEVITA